MMMIGRRARPEWGEPCKRLLLSGILAIFGLLSPVPPLAAEPAEPSAVELIEGLLSGKAPVGGPFELTDHTGRRRTDADFRGKLVVLYFGYTSCPDVCPTELQAITLALDKLGAAADAVQPLFITVDPERDTPSRLADFVSSFHPRLVALTGAIAAIRKAALAYRIFFARDRRTASRRTIRSITPASSISSARMGGI